MFKEIKAGDISEAPSDAIVRFVTKAFETQDEFIFETIRPFCEETTHMTITKDELIRALTLLREQEKTGWVPRKERLPEKPGLYLTLTCAGGTFWPQIGKWTGGEWLFCAYVHYWRPLPDMPEGVEQNGQ